MPAQRCTIYTRTATSKGEPADIQYTSKKGKKVLVATGGGNGTKLYFHATSAVLPNVPLPYLYMYILHTVR